MISERYENENLSEAIVSSYQKSNKKASLSNKTYIKVKSICKLKQ